MGKRHQQTRPERKTAAPPVEPETQARTVLYGIERDGSNWTPVCIELVGGRVDRRTLIDEPQRYIPFAIAKASDALEIYGRTLQGMKHGGEV